jgi:gas vesicle protein
LKKNAHFFGFQSKTFVYLHNNSLSNIIKQIKRMKSLGYIGAFLGGAIAGAALGILVAPEKGQDTRVKITDTIEDFLKKHNIKLSRKEVVDLVDDIQDVEEE